MSSSSGATLVRQGNAAYYRVDEEDAANVASIHPRRTDARQGFRDRWEPMFGHNDESERAFAVDHLTEETDPLDALRRLAAQYPKSEDYDDDAETLADRAAFTLAAHGLQIGVIEARSGDN